MMFITLCYSIKISISSIMLLINYLYIRIIVYFKLIYNLYVLGLGKINLIPKLAALGSIILIFP